MIEAHGGNREKRRVKRKAFLKEEVSFYLKYTHLLKIKLMFFSSHFRTSSCVLWFLHSLCNIWTDQVQFLIISLFGSNFLNWGKKFKKGKCTESSDAVAVMWWWEYTHLFFPLVPEINLESYNWQWHYFVILMSTKSTVQDKLVGKINLNYYS